MIYTILDDTGEIAFELLAPDPYFDDEGVKQYPDIVVLNTPQGCQFLEGAPPFVGWYDGKWNQRPDQPQPWDTWDAKQKAWVDTRPLDEAKAQQWVSVSTARDALLNGLFTWSGSVFQVDPDSRARIGEAVTLAQLAQGVGNNTFAITWTLADNTTRVLSIADLFNLGASLGIYFQANWNKGQALYAQIQAAQTAAEVASIVWS